MQTICGACCQQGSKRLFNQDRIFFRHGYFGKREICVAAVCDGVGSLENSAFASQLVVDYLDNWFLCNADKTRDNPRKDKRLAYEELKNSLRETLWAAHQQVSKAADDRGIESATTVCLILVVEGLYCVYSSGDSRAYEISGKVKQLTEDQIVEHDGVISLEYCLGCPPGPNFSRVEGKIRRRAAYLLATDGFYRKLNLPDAAGYLKKCSSSDALAALAHDLWRDVLSKGEKDDASGVILKFI